MEVMRILIFLTWLVYLVGCSHFQGLGNLNTGADLRGPAGLKTPDYVAEGEKPEYSYAASRNGMKKKYSPNSALVLNWPLNQIKVNQPFNPKKKRRPHLGVDFAGVKGTPIFSSHEGLVIYAGRAFKGFGKMVIVEYDDHWASLYAHLDKITVKQGQTVQPGQTLGAMGRTGRATGVHLHFELLFDQRPIDPIPLLNEAQRLVGTEGGSNQTPETRGPAGMSN